MPGLTVQVIKKSTDPSWEQEFSWQLDDSPISDSLHVEVLSKRSSMNLFHRQVILSSLRAVDVICINFSYEQICDSSILKSLSPGGPSYALEFLRV